MKTITILSLLMYFLFTADTIVAQTIKVTPVGPGIDQGAVKFPEIRAELLKRLKADQDARNESARRSEAAGPREPVASKTDAENAAWIKQVMEKYGWLGKSLVGTDGEQAAFLLVQHAASDPEFQKKCLELLEKAVRAGEAPAVYLAYLTDRVRMLSGKPQVYGTQTRVTPDGKFEVHPIEDEANVDKRREQVGLEPLAVYIERMRKRYSKSN